MTGKTRLQAVLATCLFLFGAVIVTPPAHAEWLRAESQRFIIYGDSNEREIRRRVTLLEDFDTLLQAMTGRGRETPANKLTIYLVDGNRELSLVRPASASVLGFYTASPYGIFAVSDRNGFGESNWANEVLLHEYTHHFMLQNFPAYYPTWYIEGFAEYFQTARFDDERIEVGRYSTMRAYSLVGPDARIALDRVMFATERGRTADERANFYAVSWLLVHFMLRSPTRQPQLTAYLTALGRRTDPRTAFREAFGMEPAAMERELRAYLSTSTYSRYRRASASTPPPVTVTRVGVPDAVILTDAALHMPPRRDGTPLLERVRRAANGRTDLFTRRTLAAAEIQYGDRARGVDILTDLLRQAPADAELLYLRGMAELARVDDPGADPVAVRRAARALFGRAHQADESHFQTLYRYAQSMGEDEGRPSDNTMNVLLLARSLAPQVDEIALNTALALLAREEYPPAEALLIPLAASPHANPMTRSAGLLLAAARERRTPDFAAIRVAAEAPQAGDDDDDTP